MRSLLAVVLGYVVMLVAFLGAETALTAVAPELIPQKGKPTDPLYFVFQLVTGFFFICIGGYITALLAGRSEQTPDPGRSHAHEHLHERRCRLGEERGPGLVGHGLGQQRLASARWAMQEDPLGHLGPELAEAWQVVGVNDLEVRQMVAPVARSVRSPSWA